MMRPAFNTPPTATPPTATPPTATDRTSLTDAAHLIPGHIFHPPAAVLTSISSPRNGQVDVQRYSRPNGTRCTRHWRQYRHWLYCLSGKRIPNGPYDAFSGDVVRNYLQKEPKFTWQDASRRSLRTPSKGSRKRLERTTYTCYLLTFLN